MESIWASRRYVLFSSRSFLHMFRKGKSSRWGNTANNSTKKNSNEGKSRQQRQHEQRKQCLTTDANSQKSGRPSKEHAHKRPHRIVEILLKLPNRKMHATHFHHTTTGRTAKSLLLSCLGLYLHILWRPPLICSIGFVQMALWCPPANEWSSISPPSSYIKRRSNQKLNSSPGSSHSLFFYFHYLTEHFPALSPSVNAILVLCLYQALFPLQVTQLFLLQVAQILSHLSSHFLLGRQLPLVFLLWMVQEPHAVSEKVQHPANDKLRVATPLPICINHPKLLNHATKHHVSRVLFNGSTTTQDAICGEGRNRVWRMARFKSNVYLLGIEWSH